MIDRANIKKENAAYDELIAAGYQPQGRNSAGKCAVGIPTNTGGLDVLEFNSWQDAADYLTNK